MKSSLVTDALTRYHLAVVAGCSTLQLLWFGVRYPEPTGNVSLTWLKGTTHEIR
jgi:hypothetical protein